MTVGLVRYSPEEWFEYAEASHKLVFKEIRDPAMDRISFALLAYDSVGPIGYVTCRELDSESLYWQYGGAIEGRRGLPAVRGFDAFLEETRKQYKRITTLVENGNVSYLHLAMQKGFRIIGVRCFKGQVLVELFKEFENAIQV